MRNKNKAHKSNPHSSPEKRKRENNKKEEQKSPARLPWKNTAEYKESFARIRQQRAKEREEEKREREEEREDDMIARNMQQTQREIQDALADVRTRRTGEFKSVLIVVSTEGKRKKLQLMARLESQLPTDNFKSFHNLLSKQVADLANRCKTIEVPLAKSETQLYKNKRRVINSEYSFQNAITRSYLHKSLDIINPRNCDGIIPVYITLKKQQRFRRTPSTAITEAELLLSMYRQQPQQQQSQQMSERQTQQQPRQQQSQQPEQQMQQQSWTPTPSAPTRRKKKRMTKVHVLQGCAVTDEHTKTVRPSHMLSVKTNSDRIKVSDGFLFTPSDNQDETTTELDQLVDAVLSLSSTQQQFNISRCVPYYAQTSFRVSNGPPDTVEYRALTLQRLQEFLDPSTKRPLILLFPKDGVLPPPSEPPSQKAMAKVKRKQRKQEPYKKGRITNRWVRAMTEPNGLLDQSNTNLYLQKHAIVIACFEYDSRLQEAGSDNIDLEFESHHLDRYVDLKFWKSLTPEQEQTLSLYRLKLPRQKTKDERRKHKSDERAGLHSVFNRIATVFEHRHNVNPHTPNKSPTQSPGVNANSHALSFLENWNHPTLSKDAKEDAMLLVLTHDKFSDGINSQIRGGQPINVNVFVRYIKKMLTKYQHE